MSVEAVEAPPARGLIGASGLPPAASAFYGLQTQLSSTVVAAVQRLWLQVEFANLEASWAAIAPQLLELVTAGQLAAAGGADAFLTACLGQLGIDASAFARVAPSALAGVSSDGRSLAGALYSPVVDVKLATAAGFLAQPAMRAGLAQLVTIVDSSIVDAGRQATAVGMLARPAVTGWVRAVNAGACARCVILAGRWYRFSDGFERHPRCHCQNVPTDDEVGADLVTDPHAYVDGLDEAERRRLLGEGGAQAYGQGADLNQLVNARRGMSTTRGRPSRTTTEGVTSRGLYGRQQADLQAVQALDRGGRRQGFKVAQKPRLTPDAILADTRGDRAAATALLRENGYLLDN